MDLLNENERLKKALYFQTEKLEKYTEFLKELGIKIKIAEKESLEDTFYYTTDTDSPVRRADYYDANPYCRDFITTETIDARLQLSYYGSGIRIVSEIDKLLNTKAEEE